MKNILITAACLVFMITVMGLQADCNRIIREKHRLKFAADEGAATAALHFEKESFGDGVLVYDKATAEKAAEEIVALNLKGKEYRLKIDFFDRDEKNPYVRVKISAEKIVAASTYQYVSYSLGN